MRVLRNHTPSKDGLDAARDFTKLIITLSGAGIAFIVGRASSSPRKLEVLFGIVSASLFVCAIGAGLLVLMQAATQLAKRDYRLTSKPLAVPGIVNVLAFALAAAFLAMASVPSLLAANAESSTKDRCKSLHSTIELNLN